MLAASIAHGLAGLPAWVAGIMAWVAAFMLWGGLAAGQRRQCALLVGVGLAGVVFGHVNSVSISWTRLLSENQAIIALIAGVSFVYMASTPPSVEDHASPRGSGAFLRTLLGLNVLAAAINITSLILVSDRIGQMRTFGSLEAASLSRAFSLAVLYSPFIGGMALALNQAPDASFVKIAMLGLGLTLFGIGFTYVAAKRRHSESLAQFPEYPLRPDVLWLPAVLAGAVVAIRMGWPGVPVLTAVALLAPVISWFGVARKVGSVRANVRISEHIVNRLPGMSGELMLFLSAGVLAVGLSSAFAAAGISLPTDRFPGAAAALSLLVVILAAAAGLHPIITLTALIPLLAPLNLPPEAVVILYVAGWSIGCALCPYSGTNLVLQARHDLSAWRFPLWSAGYGLFMWVLVSIVLIFLAGGL